MSTRIVPASASTKPVRKTPYRLSRGEKQPPQIVGNTGLYYVCFKLSELGWNVMPTSRNARGIDVICFSMDGAQKLAVQVKSLSKRDPVSLGTDLGKILGDVWVIVNSLKTGQPLAYILYPQEVRSLARTYRSVKKKSAEYWLTPTEYAVEAFRDQWRRVRPGRVKD